MQTKIPIFFTFDNNYVEPAAVAFYSLLNKAKKGVFYEMYVLHSDITEEKQSLLTSIVSKKENGKLTFINTDGFLADFWKNGSFNSSTACSTFTVDTIIRCFAAKFFPQYDKIIYSDVDIVVVDDISDLFDINVEDKYVAGVKNCFSLFDKNELSHLKPEHYEMLKDKYIGGGIWVMNLKKIRDDNIEHRMIEIIQDKSIIKRWNDQDIINIACRGNVNFIPLNYISYPSMIDLLKLPNFESLYTKDDLWDSIINPKIIHYAAFKPWNSNTNLSQIWWTIFEYLGLEKTHIFKTVDEHKRLKEEKTKRRFFAKLFIFSLFVAISEMVLILAYLYD